MLRRYINKEHHKSSNAAIASLISSAADISRIEHELHNFYKYPACFPPILASEVIKTFTERGDLVLDPFVGGGTAAVEAMLLGRRFLGVDLNDLAIHSSKAKTTPLKRGAISNLDSWIEHIASLSAPDSYEQDEYEDVKELSVLPGEVAYFLGKVRDSFDRIDDSGARRFAQCVVLRAAKIRLEGDQEKLSFHSIKDLVISSYERMIDAIIETKVLLEDAGEFLKPKILKGDNTTLKTSAAVKKMLGRDKVKLVVTSPPYPGISVLYNRWQIQGRRETAIPYWLIGSRQIETASYFTMGHPKTNLGLNNYFSQIKASFTNICGYLEKNTLVAQVLAFGDKKSQFHTYLDAMTEAGLVEIKNISGRSHDGRIWRSVANRKWYNQFKDGASKRSEVIFFFRKK